MSFTYSFYGELLSALLKTHQPVTFPNLKGHDRPVFVLRHDIDYGLEFLGEMPEIEAELGIVATYFIQVGSLFYNPFAVDQLRALERLKTLGHRFGLHSDSPDRTDADDLNRFIEWEKSVLSKTGVPIEAVSFHQPPAIVMDNEIKIKDINT
ncbi:MAG: hypothetical protein LBT47_10065 [Deltaproteobacteria bacterium]|jgi:hypothetical protein|nr:hypothetical protein [Deltaproteobacteria bacterium]